jgi:hypothetical protein
VENLQKAYDENPEGKQCAPVTCTVRC